MAFNNKQKALLRALIYSGIFNFPLAEEELWLDIIGQEKISKETVKKTIKSLSEFIYSKDGLFYLAGKEKIINNRKDRKEIAQKKIQIALSVAQYLSYIPTVLFIGITGKLSHIDASPADDIDIFIITKKNTIWTTRLILLAVLELMGVRRRRDDKDPRDKVCPNLIIEESALAWPAERHDLYTAHEIVHILPLFSRNNTYQKFLAKNDWTKQFYPNREGKSPKANYIKKPKSYLIIKTISLILTQPLFEHMFKKLQTAYMKKKRKNEVVLSDFLAFHPYDYRKKILKNYASQLKKYGLLTNI